MTLWTHLDAAAATGGTATAPFAVSGVSIDTRNLAPGDLFVALSAARDGHDFVAQAFAQGAAAALVARRPDGVADDAPLLIVPEVLPALVALGRAARARAVARVVAVTGSVGKTSTKEMLRAVLGGQGATHAAEASFNNHWGVPLTLARMPPDARFAVIEIGMSNPGEIAPLSRMARPHVAIVTTVAPAHLAAFASIEGIAAEKAGILDGLEPGGVAILPADIGTAPLLRARAEAAGARIVTFADGASADWELSDVQLSPEVTVARARRRGDDARLFKVASPGRHFARNALAVLAAAEALGLDPALAAADLGRWAPPAGRGMRERILLDAVEEAGFDLIDDAFNANPVSVAAALDLLAVCAPEDGVGRVGRGRRIAILGDMLELGPAETALHEAIAGHPAMDRVAVVHCVGPRMRALHAVLPRGQRGDWAETAGELAARARGLIDAGDVVLVKGSKGSRVSLVVDALRKLGQAPAR
ncbi:MAG TPA: UDP-N-acetylmuramoyl-tripeptide--D-alanyl-D-alanine ligase [Paracoccaceae bacterium]|nr:UDP-N-acetylmuramoyl-tripeptide--D-alanyl-D-alanine ligase [Paracoccaceae bacterium]HMO73321.1 UDP-N-acetylmuramoyl-tripeptide--D-alanyl-D-alanine ligase [Paracoccaceae bacterium]